MKNKKKEEAEEDIDKSKRLGTPSKRAERFLWKSGDITFTPPEEVEESQLEHKD